MAEDAEATSITEARKRISSGVPDYAPNFPAFDYDRRGRIAEDQDYVKQLAAWDAEDRP